MSNRLTHRLPLIYDNNKHEDMVFSNVAGSIDINIFKRMRGNGRSGKEQGGGGGTGRRIKQDAKLRSLRCISNKRLIARKKNNSKLGKRKQKSSYF